MCQCRVLRPAGKFPNTLMWWCARVAVDEHDMISVGREQNFKIVFIQGKCITALYPLYPNVSDFRFTYLLTYLLTYPWSRVLLEKLTSKLCS